MNRMKAQIWRAFRKRKNMTHYLQVPATGLGLKNGYRGDEWLRRRLRIFHEYVLASLTAQDATFTLWFCWRPEEKENPIVKEFQQQLSKLQRIKVIHTFNGILFYDDKYPEDVAQERLKRACEDVPDVQGEVRVTLQPSDDMYVNLKEIQDYRGDAGIIGYLKGYIMSYGTKEIAYYDPNTSPPFYTLIFKNGLKDYYERVKEIRSHEDAGLHKDFVVLERRGFVVGTHSENISTTFNHRFKGRTLGKEESEALMVRLGVLNSRRMRFGPTWRLIARKVFNILPFNNLIRAAYNSLPAKYKKV